MRRVGLAAAMVLSCLVIVLVGSTASPAESPVESPLDRLARAIDSPAVGAAATSVETVEFGRSKLKLAAGSRAFVLEAEGQACGLLVQGPATFEHRVDDRISRPVVALNLETTSTGELRELDHGEGVHWPIDGAVLWGWTLPATRGEGSEPAPALPAWVTEVLDRPFFSLPSADLIDARFNKAPDTVYGLLKRGDELVFVTYDPAHQMEALGLLDQVSGAGDMDRGRYYYYLLAAQPVGRQWWEHSPEALVAVNTRLEVDNYEGEEARITSRTTLQSTRPVSLWRADLRSRYTEDNREHLVTIDWVKVNGKPAAYRHDTNELLVDLGGEMAKDRRVDIEVQSHGRMAIQREGERFWYLGTWAWYPQPEFNGELSTFDINVRVPEPMTPFASGVTVSEKTADGFTVLESKLDKPMQYPVVAAGRYTVETKTKDGLTCKIATYGSSGKVGVDRMVDNFFAAVTFYEALFGVPYPVREVTIIERTDYGFGQAPPGIIFITQEAFETISEELRRLFSQGINERFVHEVAHAWWGQVAKTSSWEEQWISEGFAEYSAALCLEAMRGFGKKGRREFDTVLKHWQGNSKTLSNGHSIYLANYLAGKRDNDYWHRFGLLYAKAPLVLHSIRLELQSTYGEDRGDEVFYTWLRSVLANFSFSWAETRHAIGVLNQITQKDWTPWFEDYVFGCKTPKG